MNITKVIYEKYPAIWDKLKARYLDTLKELETVVEKKYEVGNDLGNLFLYELLIDFFQQEYELIISIYLRASFFNIDIRKPAIDKGNPAYYHRSVFKKQKIKSKPEAKYNAILKCCEIVGGDK